MIGQLQGDLRAGLMLLTRLPVWRAREGDVPDLSRSVWTYPLVGAVIGSIGAGTFAGLSAVNVPPLLSAILAVAVMVLATGAFHEDGLADTADGLGGGATREQKLEIMRDSRIGTYGTVAVAISLLIRVAALSSLQSTAVAVAALATIGCLSRGSIVVLLASLAPARPDGLGAVAGRPHKGTIIAGLLLALMPLIYWPSIVGASILAAAGSGTFLMWYSGRRHIGGYTGDLLGAGQQVSECACWVVLAALLS